MKQIKCDASPGRPRTFDIDEALERALQVFWQKGYAGASLSDLTEAMQISRPSLYAAFGNKETLFQKALERYANGPAAYVTESLNEPTARAVVERLLRGSAYSLTASCNPKGCLTVQGALSSGDDAASVRQTLAIRRATWQADLCKRFEQAKSDGDLSTTLCASALACYINTVLQGMAVQAAGGASRAELEGVAEIVLDNWPSR